MRYKAIVFDWAGTLIDFGSFAPMGAFQRAFAEFGVEVSIDEARAPMGAPKRDHIAAMLAAEPLAARWAAARGARPGESDIDAIYEVFVPMNAAVAADYATLVPGARDTIAWARGHGLKIGTTTGYTRAIMDKVLPAVAAQGFEPDALVCADDLPEGRPGPLGMYKIAVDLGVAPLADVVKVDDTAPGIGEGAAAGCLTVGVALSGNHAGRTPDGIAALAPNDLQALRDGAARLLCGAGAQYMIDSVADLPDLLTRLETGAPADEDMRGCPEESSC